MCHHFVDRYKVCSICVHSFGALAKAAPTIVHGISPKHANVSYKVITTMMTRPLDERTHTVCSICGRRFANPSVWGMLVSGIDPYVAPPWVPISSPLTQMAYLIQFLGKTPNQHRMAFFSYAMTCVRRRSFVVVRHKTRSSPQW